MRSLIPGGKSLDEARCRGWRTPSEGTAVSGKRGSWTLHLFRGTSERAVFPEPFEGGEPVTSYIVNHAALAM
jgi:hypothetical protein